MAERVEHIRDAGVTSNEGGSKWGIPFETRLEAKTTDDVLCHRVGTSFSIEELFDSNSPIHSLVISNRERSLLAGGTTSSWQHRLLYQPHTYVPWTIRPPKAARRCNFYRKMIHRFRDNWIEPSLILSSRRSTSRSPLFEYDGVDNVGIAAIAIEPFHIAAAAVDMQAIDAYQERRRRNQVPALEELIAKPFRVAAFDPERCGRQPHGTFFGLEWFGDCRLIPRSNESLTNLSRSYSGRGIETARSVLKVAASVNDLLAVASTRLRPWNTDGVIDQVIVFFGGKDQLALDWLPFISRALHNFASAGTGRRPDRRTEPVGGGLSHLECTFKPLILLMEYPGYGFNIGTMSPEESLKQAANVLERVRWMYARDKKVPMKVHIVGYSLGSGPALRLANWVVDQDPGHFVLSRLHLLAPITSLGDCAAELLRLPDALKGLASNIVRAIQSQTIAWTNEDDISRLMEVLATRREFLPHVHHCLLTGPQCLKDFQLNIIHGNDDQTVPISMGLQLAKVARHSLERRLACPAEAKARYIAEHVVSGGVGTKRFDSENDGSPGRGPCASS